MLLLSGLILMILCNLFKRPMLYLFGASDQTYPYASAYITVYLCGTLFVMISLGMNFFINAQGFGMIGMLTVSIGAVLNLILDPFYLWTESRSTGCRSCHHPLPGCFCPLGSAISDREAGDHPASDFPDASGISLIRRSVPLDLAGFVMAITNGSVQIMCNAMLARYGGDLYVGIMTVINSVREIINMPIQGLTNGAQPVMSFNYGARKYSRVKSAIRFTTIWSIFFSTLLWFFLFFFPKYFIQAFQQ